MCFTIWTLQIDIQDHRPSPDPLPIQATGMRKVELKTNSNFPLPNRYFLWNKGLVLKVACKTIQLIYLFLPTWYAPLPCRSWQAPVNIFTYSNTSWSCDRVRSRCPIYIHRPAQNSLQSHGLSTSVVCLRFVHWGYSFFPTNHLVAINEWKKHFQMIVGLLHFVKSERVTSCQEEQKPKK